MLKGCFPLVLIQKLVIRKLFDTFTLQLINKLCPANFPDFTYCYEGPVTVSSRFAAACLYWESIATSLPVVEVPKKLVGQYETFLHSVGPYRILSLFSTIAFDCPMTSP